MRPVNLIPVDERRGDSRPLRTGPLAYIVLGALALLLLGVTMLVLANNDLSDREAEVATVESEVAAAKTEAEELAPYTQFKAMSEERVSTVVSLADSRFDWERVMRELALILPSDVWLISLDASASPDSGGGGGGEGGSSLRGGVSGPALELSGCAESQDAVAGFVTALKDIDAATRVGVQSSQRGSAESGPEECPTQFSLVVAFDAAPVPITGSSTEPATEEVPTESSEETDSEEGGTEESE